MTTELKKNVDSFNRDVAKNEGYLYTTNAQFSSIVANRRLTEATIQAITPGAKKIIDIGCGDGVYTAELKTAFPDAAFTGLDPASTAIERAQKQFPNISFLVGNALDPATLPSESYDIAVFRGILHHASNPALAIKNLAARAKKVIIIEPNGNNMVLKLIEKLSSYHREHEERSFFPRTIRKWCKDAGLQVKSVEYAGFVPFFFPTWPAKIIFAMQPLLEKLPVVKHLFSAVSVIQCEQP